MAKGVAEVKKAQGKEPKQYTDIREALQDKSIDVVTIATPNHWHSLAAYLACAAGKDVYVEKPMSHNIYEGRQIVAAAQKFGRIVQHGTQNRSNATYRRDMKLMHDGFIGEIIESRGYVYKNGNRGPIGHGATGPVPENLDWKLWQGPSTDHPFMINKDRRKPGLYVHYDWHYFWSTAMARLATRACIRWMLPYGATTAVCRLKYIVPAVAMAWGTTAKRRTRRQPRSRMPMVRL